MMKDASHIVMLAVVLAAIAVGFFAVRTVMVPEGFGSHGSYTYGYFRAASEDEQASRSAAYQGADKCRGCHGSSYDVWKTGEHASVGCEACHGKWQAHNANTREKIAQDTSAPACMVCHERILGRPATFPQIDDIAAHSADKGGDPQEHKTCVACHNPHDPV